MDELPRNRVPSSRDLHRPQHVIRSKSFHAFAIDVSNPPFRVPDFREDTQTRFIQIGLVFQVSWGVIDQFNGA